MRQGFQVSLTTNGIAHFQIFPPAHPLVSYRQDAVAIIGRLYYLEDLQARFPQAFSAPLKSLADLVFSLYQIYGWSALTYLEGEFALVLFDAEESCLLTLRDPLGSYPLYWRSHQGILEVSTNLELLQTPQIDLDFLGSFLMTPFAFVELDTEKTAYQGSQRILAGNLTRLQPNTKGEKIWVWDWQEKIVPQTDITLSEAAGQFLELLKSAIAQRRKYGQTASHLSGGMDSSAIACIAQDIITLSLVYHLPSLAPENRYIEMILQENPRLSPHYIDGDSCLDFQWFEQGIPPHDEPYQGLCSFPMDRAILQAAANLGVNTVLTGIGAEIITQGNRYYLGDLLRQGKYQKLLEEAKAWSRAKNINLWSILYPYALLPLIPTALRQGIPTLMRGGYATGMDMEAYGIPPWIEKDFARSYHLWSKARQKMPQFDSETLERAQQMEGIKAFIGNWNNWYLANPLNIHLSHPYLDPRLIVFCLSLPTSLREDPLWTKPILQEAMKGILPEPIRTRRYKANFNEVYARGLSQALPQIKALILASKISQLGIFQPQVLIDIMEQQALGLGTVVSGSKLNNSLTLIAWYSLT